MFQFLAHYPMTICLENVNIVVCGGKHSIANSTSPSDFDHFRRTTLLCVFQITRGVYPCVF